MIFVFLILHVAVCVLVYILIQMSILKCADSVMPLVCMVPVWGVAAMLVLEIRTRGDQTVTEEVGIEKLKINDAVYKSILVEDDPMEDQVVPLEEALLINSPVTRRELMMEVMYADPNDYVEQLKEARMNDDTEVVHYAVTALAELQKKYELQFQELEWRLSQDADDGDVIDEYLKVLDRYLSSGIAEGNDRKLKRKIYSRMLGEKLRRKPEKLSLWSEKARTDLEIGAYEEARREIAHILSKWKDQEDGYLLQIQYCAAKKDRQGIDKMLCLIKEREIYLTSKGRKELAFWSEEEETQKE
ncbi:MAG TPA: hypothetical protein IAA11_01280 [Candidatus Blautia intestinigallinarum]|nr:hypothetical protein [Candidatus Blautia intestinigallinarum]